MTYNNNPPLGQRSQFVLFLQGCLHAVTGEFVGPANPEALRHFLEGQQAVWAGNVRIGDPAAARAFIEDVKVGRWPERRAEKAVQ